MPSVDFQLRSLKINDPFSARLRFLLPDKQVVLESKTELYVFSPDEVLEMPLVNGKKFWKDNRKKKKLELDKQTRIVNILNDQENLRKFILDKCESNNYSEDNLPTKEWFQSIVKEYFNNLKKIQFEKDQDEESLDIQYHFNRYIKLKRNSLAPRTILKLEDTKKIFKGFEEYQSLKKGFDVVNLITEVNPEFQYDLEEYLSKELLYSRNTIAKTIKVLKTICNYAQKRGVQLNKSYGLVSMPYEESDVVYLSFSELQQIKNSDKIPEELEDARWWLYLSCFLGQRISDFMRFNPKMMRKEGEDYYIDFVQEKTNKKIALMLHSEVVKYLQGNNMEFPSPIEEYIYNDQIKDVCKLAGINEKIEGSVLKKVKDRVWRKQKGIYEKWELIGSHIGRKSYCTNFYSKIPTSLLLQVSGHSEERTLLSYIGKKDPENAKMMKKYYDEIDVTKD